MKPNQIVGIGLPYKKLRHYSHLSNQPASA